MTTKLSAVEANRIQKLWMDLDCNAPKADQQKVFKLMELFPKNHLTVSADEMTAQAMFLGCPVCARMPIDQCIKAWGSQLNSSLCWSSNGEWMDIPMLQKRLADRKLQAV